MKLSTVLLATGHEAVVNHFCLAAVTAHRDSLLICVLEILLLTYLLTYLLTHSLIVSSLLCVHAVAVLELSRVPLASDYKICSSSFGVLARTLLFVLHDKETKLLPSDAFLNREMHKNAFWPGPGFRWGSLHRSPRFPAGLRSLLVSEGDGAYVKGVEGITDGE